MYRVLIVDDEQEIRHGLRLKADWEGLDLAVAGEASNGEEALERLGAEPIDIVITDMNMPVMDGVSLLDACREHYPSVRLIVVTGYEDFRYAKAAIKSHAEDYLLKPVSREEMNEALGKVVRSLDEERSRRDEQATVLWKMTRFYRESREHFLVQLVKEEAAGERTLRERSKLLGLEEWGEIPVRVLTAGLASRTAGGGSGHERTPDRLRAPFEMLAEEFADTYPAEPRPVSFRNPGYPGLVHFIVAEEEKAFETELRECVLQHLGLEPAVGAGEAVTGFEAWKESYSSSLLSWTLTAGGAADKQAAETTALSRELSARLEHYLAQGEMGAFEKAVEQELSAAYRESRMTFVKRIFQLYLLLEGAAPEAQPPLRGGEPLWLRPDLVWSMDTVDKAKAYLLRLAEGWKPADQDPERSLMESVRRYIDENYMYDVNLTMLASRYTYHPSYFSEWFKAKIGKTFIQYLTEVRMEKAVRLLEDTSLNLWDVAELTGFSNPSYFSAKFKKMYGITPSEYRQTRPEKSDRQEPKK